MKFLFPNFLGIGAPKAGTTWLHALLSSHREVWMPNKRKEVHYFDQNYDRGVGWYGQFFPGQHSGVAFKALGEFTPHYLYHPDAPLRIKSFGGIEKLIVSLRDPVARAISHYRFRCQIDHYRGDFAQFLQDYPEAIEWGMYAKYLERYLDIFQRSQVLVIVFERAVADSCVVLNELADFLGIEREGFTVGPDDPVHASFVPKRPGLYSGAVRLSNWLNQHDLYGPLRLAKNLGVKRFLQTKSNSNASFPVDATLEAALRERFLPTISRLENLMGITLDEWRRDHG